MADRHAGLTLRKTPEEEDEPISYRAAVWGGLLSFVFIVAFCSYAGMPVAVCIPLMVVAFAYLLAMTRLVSEAGMPWMDEPHWRAHDVIRSLVPYRSLSADQLGIAGDASDLHLRHARLAHAPDHAVPEGGR